MKHSTLAGWLLISLTAVSPSIAQDRDKVFPLGGGATATGKIETIARDRVVINVKGKAQTYKTNEIAKVVFDDEPTSLENARNFIANRQFNQADAELKKIGQVKDERIAKDIQFYKGYVSAKMALSGMGDPLVAAKELAV
ncbi:MAG: hypothetical protein IT423_14680, partial [Pirellulaceae bacterium]|nr:hypothetical protein [Pirellulaceae bacterium]